MNAENLTGVLALVGLLILTFLFIWLLGKEGKSNVLEEEEKRSNRIHSMARDAFIIGLIVLMTFVPNIGFINIGPFSLTLLHLPVLLGAGLFGWKKGALYGLVFGLMSWIKALTGATNVFDLAFQKIYVAVPPRLLFGLIAGILFSASAKIGHIRKRMYAMMGIAFLATCLHTVMVFLLLFVSEEWVAPWLFSSDPAIKGTAITVLGFLGIGMGLEALLGALLTPTLVGSVRRAVPSLRKQKQS